MEVLRWICVIWKLGGPPCKRLMSSSSLTASLCASAAATSRSPSPGSCSLGGRGRAPAAAPAGGESALPTASGCCGGGRGSSPLGRPRSRLAVSAGGGGSVSSGSFGSSKLAVAVGADGAPAAMLACCAPSGATEPASPGEADRLRPLAPCRCLAAAPFAVAVLPPLPHWPLPSPFWMRSAFFRFEVGASLTSPRSRKMSSMLPGSSLGGGPPSQRPPSVSATAPSAFRFRSLRCNFWRCVAAPCSEHRSTLAM
mmetsp:Transcript_83425/g.241435  ORF Transcript_83425/g.241435 Transcript_83425/m.241435 type:complete len:254 (-) Transcript_83425:865-1626(-)